MNIDDEIKEAYYAGYKARCQYRFNDLENDEKYIDKDYQEWITDNTPDPKGAKSCSIKNQQ